MVNQTSAFLVLFYLSNKIDFFASFQMPLPNNTQFFEQNKWRKTAYLTERSIRRL